MTQKKWETRGKENHEKIARKPFSSVDISGANDDDDDDDILLVNFWKILIPKTK